MNNLMWTMLVHISTNMWYEEGNTRGMIKNDTWRSPASSSMRFDEKSWDFYLDTMKKKGVNTIIMDVGDALIYDSHPELAIEGSWSKEKMKAEIERLNKMGFEVIPKLNFSTAHDIWLKEYSYKVSTPEYYQVCRDLIDEVCELFKPRFFHLGMDEETYYNQRNYNYAVIRHRDLWWHDLNFFVDCVEAHGARPMMWNIRENLEEFVERCPKSVVQCVWYYYDKFYGRLSNENAIRVRPLKYLAEKGFDIIPTGSISFFEDNFQKLVEYCKKKVPAERIIGYSQTTWNAVTPEFEEEFAKACDSFEIGKKFYE